MSTMYLMYLSSENDYKYQKVTSQRSQFRFRRICRTEKSQWGFSIQPSEKTRNSEVRLCKVQWSREGEEEVT
jgi:hypothetical protein